MPVVSKFSLVDAHFEPDMRWVKAMGTKSTVSCGPGFGVREVFCAACPPHHYSPDRSTVCLKCDKGYHQPVAGSSKCVRRLNFLIQGRRMVQVQYDGTVVAWLDVTRLCRMGPDIRGKGGGRDGRSLGVLFDACRNAES